MQMLPDPDARVDTMPHPILSMGQMRAELVRQVTAVGGVNAFCRARGIDSHTAVSLAMAGHRNVTEAIANSIGYIVETTFRRIGDQT